MKALAIVVGISTIICCPARAGQLMIASIPWAGALDVSPVTRPASAPLAAVPDIAAPTAPSAAPSTVPLPKAPPALASRKAVTIPGYASFYDTGRVTANGERFAPMGLTAAHRSLPFGTRVKVTNKRTGQSIVVRVNDRGPYIAGRMLDLSRGAARAIGMESAGVAPITMEIVSDNLH